MSVPGVAASAAFKSGATIRLVILTLRHQLDVLQRSVKQPKLTPPDRFLWAWLCGAPNDRRAVLVTVNPDNVIACHRKGMELMTIAWTVAPARMTPTLCDVPGEDSGSLQNPSPQDWALAIYPRSPIRTKRQCTSAISLSTCIFRWQFGQSATAFSIVSGPPSASGRT